MKTTLIFSIFILLFFSCRKKPVVAVKINKIAVHTFIGKGNYREITYWYFIKDISRRGFSGFYLESGSKVNDFKQVPFVYSEILPPRFKGQAASDEKLQFLNPNDLPGDLQKRVAQMESLSQ